MDSRRQGAPVLSCEASRERAREVRLEVRARAEDRVGAADGVRMHESPRRTSWHSGRLAWQIYPSKARVRAETEAKAQTQTQTQALI